MNCSVLGLSGLTVKTADERPRHGRSSVSVQGIRAHLMICFMALTMMRLIQLKIKKLLPEDKAEDMNWSYGIPGERFQKALLEWQIDKLPGEYFRMLNVANPDLLLILRSFGVSLSPKLYTRGEIRSLNSSVCFDW